MPAMSFSIVHNLTALSVYSCIVIVVFVSDMDCFWMYFYRYIFFTLLLLLHWFICMMYFLFIMNYWLWHVMGQK